MRGLATWTIPAWFVATLAGATGPVPAPEKIAPESVLFRNASVWTMEPDGRIDGADVLVEDGKISAVGKNLTAPAGAEIVDATGKHITPGLIDCHSHSAIRGGVNEGSNNITAEVRIEDVIEPDDVDLYRALAGGLTTAHLLHGSANSIGGQDAVIKLKWRATPEEALVAGAAPGIKFALGENPKRSNFRRPDRPQRYPATRMGVMESIRARFAAARDYMREWETYDALSSRAKRRREPPRRDLQLEAIAEILRGERLIHSHAYRQDEMLALVRVAEEFGVRIGTFQHVLEGYKIADELAAHGAGASTFSDWWAYKLEAFDAIPHNGALMHERGVSVTFNSDSAELARRMNLEAAKAVKYGEVDEQSALAFVTRNAAEQLGIADRVGSLAPGKDADLVVWSGDPLSVYTIAEQTWVDGTREFDRGADLAFRELVAAERARSISEVRRGRGKEAEEDDEKKKDESPEDESRDRKAPADPVRADWADRLAGSGETVSIVGATVHTVAGGTIRNGTVSFRDGRIVEVAAGAAPLPDARVVDGTGKHVYPGLIDAMTSLGLVEIGSVAGSVDLSEVGGVNPQINTAIAVNPDSELIPVTRANGLTHVLTAPTGGLVSGTSAVIRLDGWTWEDLRASAPAALHVQWPSFQIRRQSFFGPPPPSEEDQKKEREENLRSIRRLFEDARAYVRARTSGAGEPVDLDPKLEAMIPVLEGRVPVIVHADEIRQIRSAVEWIEEEDGVRMVLAGSGDVWRVADLLRDSGIPVIVTSVLSRPAREDEPYDTAYAVPAKLHEAGATFCIATGGGSFGSSNTRNLPYHAGMAAAHGLSRAEALRAVTLHPARILGLDHEIGSVEVGKSASLILTDGDPLEIRTRVLLEWIDGREVDVEENKHARLYRRYRERPRSTPDSDRSPGK